MQHPITKNNVQRNSQCLQTEDGCALLDGAYVQYYILDYMTLQEKSA